MQASTEIIDNLYEQFKRSRRFLKNVTEQTVRWYDESFAFYRPILAGRTLNEITKADFLPHLEALRKRDVAAVTINSRSRAIQAFFHWAQEEEYIDHLIKIPKLKEDELIIESWTSAQIARFMQFKPKSNTARRAWMVGAVVLDTGMRLNEVLTLDRREIDLDNMLITVHGKGRKQRIVPMTTDLRRSLFRYMEKHQSASNRVFYAGDGIKMWQNNIRRDFGVICRKLDIKAMKGGFHILRHTFALNYIRNGGDVFRLQKILGHSTLEMTRRYVNLQTEDLQRVHQQFSVLAQASR